jgi:hypothetical protein
MAWLAATFHEQLNAGTELAIFQEPWNPDAVVTEQNFLRVWIWASISQMV